MERREEEARVRAALSELSAIQRETLLLAYYEHHTYVEMAALLGLPLGTVKSRGRLALAALRVSLVGDEQNARPAVPAAAAPTGALVPA